MGVTFSSRRSRGGPLISPAGHDQDAPARLGDRESSRDRGDKILSARQPPSTRGAQVQVPSHHCDESDWEPAQCVQFEHVFVGMNRRFLTW